MSSIESEPKTSWEAFSETDAVESLRSKGVDNVALAFGIENEKTTEGDDVNAEKIFWMKLDVPQTEEKEGLIPIEGKIYFPKDANGELIIFTPGFPGGNSGRFEKIYIQAFLDAGYTFFTIRHNGTSLTNGALSADILNSPKRMDIALKGNEHHIGGTTPEGCSPDKVMDEPIVAIKALQQKFQKIHLVGHSIGVASNYNAVTKLKDDEEFKQKLGNIIGIASYLVDEQESPNGIWNGMKNFESNEGSATPGLDAFISVNLDYAKKVDLNFTFTADEYKEFYSRLANTNKNMVVPENAGNILVYCPEDPLIAGPDFSDENSILNYGPKSKRKLIIEDLSKPAHDKKAHSMLWIKPENLVRAVQTKVSDRGPHLRKVGNSGTKIATKV